MPSIAITRAYEAVYILDPNSGEDQISAITSRYRGLVEAQGGEVQKVDVWERRKLAYEIKGRSEGIYVIMHFSGTPNVEVELRRVFQISEDQIRYMIVKLEEAKEDANEALAPASVRHSAATPLESPAADETDSEAPISVSEPEEVTSEAAAEPEAAELAA